MNVCMSLSVCTYLCLCVCLYACMHPYGVYVTLCLCTEARERFQVSFYSPPYFLETGSLAESELVWQPAIS